MRRTIVLDWHSSLSFPLCAHYALSIRLVSFQPFRILLFRCPPPSSSLHFFPVTKSFLLFFCLSFHLGNLFIVSTSFSFFYSSILPVCFSSSPHILFIPRLLLLLLLLLLVHSHHRHRYPPLFLFSLLSPLLIILSLSSFHQAKFLHPFSLYSSFPSQLSSCQAQRGKLNPRSVCFKWCSRANAGKWNALGSKAMPYQQK